MLALLLFLLGPVLDQGNLFAGPAESSIALRCPDDMRLVRGTHFEHVQRICLRLVVDVCWEFHPDVIVLEPRETTIAVCIDQYEWPNQKGARPPVMMRFTEAVEQCRSVEKRLCSEFEWELACEGPATIPFPYGYKHEPGACVNDKPYRNYDAKKLESSNQAEREREVKRLYQAEPSGSRPRCDTPFGVSDMVGNVEEWVTTSRPEWPFVSSLKGGYWSKPWSKCRGTNDSHGPNFRFYEIGFRCCRAPALEAPGHQR